MPIRCWSRKSLWSIRVVGLHFGCHAGRGKVLGMRAIVCETWGLPESLQVLEVADPQAKAGELVIRILAAGVNFPDVLIIQKKYQLVPELPFTPGAEFAGEVLSVGAGVTDFVPGDRVAALCQVGAFAEQIAMPAEQVFKIPATLNPQLAATVLFAYGTSWHALRDRAQAKAGETMLVLGAAGGVGLAAIQIGKLMGLRVVAAASTEAKLALCRENGADEGINYEEEDLRAGVKRTCGKGPDIIYDPVGGRFAEPAFRSIAWRGRYLVVGFAAGAIPAIPLNLPLLKGASIVGVYWGNFLRFEAERWRLDFHEMVAAIEAGDLKPHVSKAYTLDETAQALDDMADRKVEGKIVIVP